LLTLDQSTNQVKRLLKLRKQSRKIIDINGVMARADEYHTYQQELQLVGLTMIDLSYILPDMKTIKPPYKHINPELIPEGMTTRTNPFSGQSIELPNYVAEVYDYLMLANLVAEKEDAKNGWGSSESEWKIVRKGLDWFRQHFAKEYMVLLD